MIVDMDGGQDLDHLDQVQACAGTRNVVPYFRAGEPFNMNVYLSYAQQPQHKLLWNVEQVPLSESSYRRQLSVNLTADDLSEVCPHLFA